MMSVQIFILATFTVVSGAIVGHAGSDASGTGTRQPNADETHTDVVSMDVAEDIRARQERRRAIREIKERQMEAVRAEADARAQLAMEAARNATLAADRARHKRHEEMRKDGELPVVPASTVVHLVRIPHPKNQTVHRHQNHNTFNQTGTPIKNTSASTIASTPQLAKALASKNITHTSAAANASRLNATKTAEKHKEVIAAKANNISQKAAQAASKGVTAAFHSARMAAEKLRKNHLAKRESIERKRSTESDGDSEEKIHAEKIKKAVIEVEGDDLANALKGVFSFPAKVKTTSTTTTTTTTTSTTTTTTAETTTALATVTTTTTAQAANETMDVVAKNFSNASMNVVAQNVSNANANMDVVAKDVRSVVNSSVVMFSAAVEAPKDTSDAELDKINAEIKKDQEDKKKAIDKDDLETALVLKKELEELTKKRNALEPHNTSSTPNRTTELAFFFGKAPDVTAQQPAINKSSAVALHSPLRAAKIAASKLRGTHE